ncbi:MAG: hypothetical protein AAFP04_15985, partial [Myxococcota bacterium]
QCCTHQNENATLDGKKELIHEMYLAATREDASIAYNDGVQARPRSREEVEEIEWLLARCQGDRRRSIRRR